MFEKYTDATVHLLVFLIATNHLSATVFLVNDIAEH